MRMLVVASSERELLGFSRFSGSDGESLERIIRYGESEIVGVSVGVGLVQAAIGTFAAVEQWSPDYVICFGTGGAVHPDLGIGDIVSADEVIQYSLDLRAFKLARGESFGADPGSIIAPVKSLVRIPCVDGYRRMDGVIGSADMFITRAWREANPWILDELHVILADMESFAVADVCRRHDLPCSVVRVVSDTARGERPKRYGRFLTETVAGILVSVVESIIEGASDRAE